MQFLVLVPYICSMTNRIEIFKLGKNYKVRFISASHVHATIDKDYTSIKGCYRAIVSHYIMILQSAGCKVSHAAKPKFRNEITMTVDGKQITIPVKNKARVIIKQEPELKKPRVK